MISIKRLASRGMYTAAAIAFGAAIVVPSISPSGKVAAAGQLSTRKLTQSSQALGTVSSSSTGTAYSPGAPGNGAKAYYGFTFGLATAGQSIGSMAIQFCSNSPLPQTACTVPTGMDATAITGTVTTTGFATNNTWNVDTTASTTTGYFSTAQSASRANIVLLAQPTAVATVSGTPTVTFTLGSSSSIFIKNPTSAMSFYARLVTFSDLAYTTAVDDGAAAGSATQDFNITSKVQEKLNFSSSAIASLPTAACNALTGTGAQALGDPTNGVLDPATAYFANTYFRLSTNASAGTGTVVQYSGDTLKSSSGNLITGIGTTPTASTVGTQQFGITLDSTDTTGGGVGAGAGYSFANLARTAPYNADATFAFDTASLTTPKTLATAPAGTVVGCDTGSVKYVVNITTTTKAGLYSTRIIYSALPTF